MVAGTYRQQCADAMHSYNIYWWHVRSLLFIASWCLEPSNTLLTLQLFTQCAIVKLQSACGAVGLGSILFLSNGMLGSVIQPPWILEGSLWSIWDSMLPTHSWITGGGASHPQKCLGTQSSFLPKVPQPSLSQSQYPRQCGKGSAHGAL